MARVLDKWPEPIKREYVKREWIQDEWFDGQIWELTPDDYPLLGKERIYHELRRHAAHLQLRLKVSFRDKLTIQAIERIERKDLPL